MFPLVAITAKIAVTAATVVTAHVAPGQSLSTIAQQHGTTWQAVYLANRRTVGANPNVIYPGESLTIPAGNGLSAVGKVSLPAPPQSPVQHYRARHAAATVEAVPVHSTYTAPAPAPVRQAATYSGSGGGSMEQCIISRESGGNSQVMNGSGHYGLFQFSESTWVGSGGSAADFGHASVAEQQQVFDNAVAARGYSDWQPWDGC